MSQKLTFVAPSSLSLVLWTSCFEPDLDCSTAEVILATVVNEKLAAQAPVWYIKSPSYRLGKTLSKQRNCGLADSAAATVAVTPAKSESPNFYNFNTERRHNIQTSHRHAFKQQNTVFCTVATAFQCETYSIFSLPQLGDKWTHPFQCWNLQSKLPKLMLPPLLSIKVS